MYKRKSYTAKSLLISLLIGLSISGCNNVGAPSTQGVSSPTLKITSTNKGVILGAAAFKDAFGNYDVISNSSYIPYDGDAPIKTSNPVFNSQLKQDMTAEEILKTLGIDGSLKGGYKDLSGDFTANYLDQTKNSSNEIRATFYNYYYKHVSFTNPEKFGLVDAAKNLPSSEVGSGFISGANAGIFVEATVHIKFKTSSSKNDILAKGNIDFSNLVNLSGSLSKLDDETKKQIEIEIELVQRGGDAQEIINSLKDVSNQSGGTIDASKPYFLTTIGIDSTYKLLDSIQYYIGTSFNQQIKEYIEDGTDIKVKKLSDLGKLFVIGDGISMHPYNNSTTVYTQDETLLKLTEDHSKEYSQLLDKIAKFNKYLDVTQEWIGSLSTPPKALAQSEEIKDKLNMLSTSFSTDAKLCYPAVIDEANISNCKKLLQADIDSANLLKQDLDNLGWQKGYKLRTAAAGSLDTEYLIPIGSDEEGIKYFMTYTAFPSASTFSYGAIYQLGADNTISAAFIPEPIGGDSIAGTVAFTGKATKSGLGLSFSNITYTNQNGEAITKPNKALGTLAPNANINY